MMDRYQRKFSEHDQESLPFNQEDGYFFFFETRNGFLEINRAFRYPKTFADVMKIIDYSKEIKQLPIFAQDQKDAERLFKDHFRNHTHEREIHIQLSTNHKIWIKAVSY